MKILVLGSEGFIGSHLISFLTAQNEEVCGCDLLEAPVRSYPYYKVSILSPDFIELFQKHDFDVCINASGSGNVSYSLHQPLSDFYFNTASVVHVLDAIRKFSPQCKYIHISSAAVYGNPKKLPVEEKSECAPLSPYGWHKLQSEAICKEYFSVFNVACCIVRPFSVYGPGLRKQLFWDVFQKWKASNSRVSLWGTGNESRDFIYITDLANAFYLLMNKAPMKAEVYNLATGIEVTISEAVKRFFSNFDAPVQISFNGVAKPGDPGNWKADISAIQELGFSVNYCLETGLAQTATWLLKNEQR